MKLFIILFAILALPNFVLAEQTATAVQPKLENGDEASQPTPTLVIPSGNRPGPWINTPAPDNQTNPASATPANKSKSWSEKTTGEKVATVVAAPIVVAIAIPYFAIRGSYELITNFPEWAGVAGHAVLGH